MLTQTGPSQAVTLVTLSYSSLKYQEKDGAILSREQS